METIKELMKVDFPSVFISVFAILMGVKSIASIFEWTVERLGLETKWMKSKREDHELIVNTAKSLAVLQEKHEEDVEKSDTRDEEISNDIKALTRMFIDKEIDDIRWEINNFATKVSEGKPCNKDSYKHCISIYQKYEKLLEENGFENGEVEISMEIINESYKQKLKEGF